MSGDEVEAHRGRHVFHSGHPGDQVDQGVPEEEGEQNQGGQLGKEDGEGIHEDEKGPGDGKKVELRRFEQSDVSFNFRRFWKAGK